MSHPSLVRSLGLSAASLLIVSATGFAQVVAQTPPGSTGGANPGSEKSGANGGKPIPAPAPAVAPGYGSLKIDGNDQVWIGAFTHPDATYMKLNGFGMRLRRIELALNGVVDPHVQYHIMADFARGSSVQAGSIGILQDAFVEYLPGNTQSIMVGQTKLPLTEVGLASASHLPTIERPMLVVEPGLKVNLPGVTSVPTPQWGDVRDMGVQYKKTTKVFTAQVALLQGAGDYQDVVSNQYGKQVVAEFFFRPLGTDELQFGITGSGGAGYTFQPAAAAGKPALPPVHLKRNRGGGSIIWRHDRWYAESEYVGGVDGVGYVTATDAAVNTARHGEYGILGYDLGGYKGGDGNQIVAMEDYWDPGAGMPRRTNTVIGLNHDTSKGHSRIQANYIHESFSGGIAAPANSKSDGLVLAFGTSW